MSQAIKSTSPINKRRSIEELKMKYENSPVFETPKMSTKPKSPKKLKKSKVKQMASMFNTKMSQLIKRESEVGKYATLVNEFSPEAKPQPTANLVRPSPKPRTRFTKPKAPVPSPRTKTLSKIEIKPSACFVAEDEFAKLSVKDKAKYYTQFVEEISKKNPQFAKHVQLLEVSNINDINRSGVIVEKQATVKDLLDELEFNNVFPKSSNAKNHALQRMDSMKRALAKRKNLQVNTSTPIKAKEFEDILDMEKPTNQQKVKSLPRLHLANDQELSTQQQDLTTNSIFQNQQLEDLFFSWFKEKHVKDDGVEDDMSNQSEVDEEKQKSAIDKLLEEAIAKLEVLEIEQNSEVFETPKNNCYNSTEESESGLSSLPKNTSEEEEESQIESQSDNNFENDFVFAKPLKSLRKKKLRRNAIFKKEVSQNEVSQINSTDSESDSKQDETKLKNKKLFLSSAAQEQEKILRPTQPEAEEELNESLMRVVNSPRKIKSAYTLTVLETPLCTPRSSLNFAKTHLNRSQIASDTLTDQGFETATNDESPHKRTAVSEVTNSSLSSTLNTSKANFGYSTPIKAEEHHSFANSGCGSAKQLFSPIAKPMKNRRKSFYDMEPRRNSLAMEVIREDQPLESQTTNNSSNFINQSEQTFCSKAPTMEMSKESANKPIEKISQFWINCGDFLVALEINFNEAERLRLLYEIFSQTSCETKDLHFGIDDQKFSVHGSNEMDNTSTRIPAPKGCSHYWFSTGDLTIPFSGKYLSSHKIQRLFRTIKETVEETGILRFGVDEVEFSNVPEFWYQPAKLSVESQYSMLVGLQSGDSNGLEGRSKFAWPHSKPVMISDLDESDNFEEIERGRLSFSPFGSNHYDLASLDNEELSMPRNSQAMMSLESYCGEYESEPLDHLFDESEEESQQSQNLSLPKGIQEHLTGYVKPIYIPKDALDALKGTPEYVTKLKDIVADISNIGCSNHFKSCSVDELESYMHFLSRYSEICSNSCTKHMDAVLEALVDYKAVVV